MAIYSKNKGHAKESYARKMKMKVSNSKRSSNFWQSILNYRVCAFCVCFY